MAMGFTPVFHIPTGIKPASFERGIPKGFKPFGTLWAKALNFIFGVMEWSIGFYTLPLNLM
jgi:hypothetical protein